MRILVDYRPALRERTGVGEYVHQTATALAASRVAGETLSIFSASWKDRLSPHAVAGAASVDSRVPGHLLHLLWHRLEWPPVERLAGGSYDIVQSAHPLLIPSRGAARLVTIYDLDFLDYPERTEREIRRDYAALAASHARRADQIVVISEHTAGAVASRLDVPSSRISICTPGAPDWRARQAEPAIGACLLFLGTLEPRKNLDVLVDAYARVLTRRPDAPPLVLAGRVTAAAESLVARLGEPPFAGHVELPGYITSEAREALYHRALIFVLPSHTEGFGIPVLEAMMAGVPVVAANRGAIPEAAGSAGALFDPADAGALAELIVALLDDAPRRRSMAEAGRRHAATFTWQRTAASVRGAWRLALAHRAERRG